MKRAMLLLSLVAVVGLVVVLQAMAGANSAKVLKFERMAAVVPPFTGSTNPIRGIGGGGVPWAITREPAACGPTEGSISRSSA